MAVNLDPSFGRVEVTYLTGQGRALNDYYLEITRQTIQNGANRDVVIRDSLSPLPLRLEGFQTSIARLNVPFSVSASGRPDSLNFTQFVFDPNRLLQENGRGGLDDTGTDLSAAGIGLPLILDARIRAFPGRSSAVQVRVSSATFMVDDDGNATFDAAEFRNLNTFDSGTDPDGQGRVASRFSDFVRFPLINLPAGERPTLRTDSVDPTAGIADGGAYLYMSGDNIAISSGPGSSQRIFEEIGDEFTSAEGDTPGFPSALIGKWSDAASGGFLGTYDLRDALPTDDSGNTRIVSVYGQFRDYNTVLSGGTSFEIVMFPNSGETYTFEDNGSSGVRGREGDIVAFVRNANNQIVSMYVGGVDLGAGTFELFPVRFLGGDPTDPEALAAELQGTISGLRDLNGSATGNPAAVRSFSYNFTTPGLPSGFSNSGNVTVFRK